jgi:hypothetical protein
VYFGILEDFALQLARKRTRWIPVVLPTSFGRAAKFNGEQDGLIATHLLAALDTGSTHFQEQALGASSDRRVDDSTANAASS